jgi:DNA-binding transcriptional LysR family regulator
MHERYRNANIPIELLRTLVTIAETGSFTKAASKLSLSQPAISAQVRRLQSVVGGALFEKVAGGISLNERGRLVLAHVRRLLDANDRILALTGPARQGRPLRVGVSYLYVSELFRLVSAQEMKGIHVYCDRSEEIVKGMIEGYIDVCCSPFQRDSAPLSIIAEWEEPLVWVRGPEFLLSPGAAIPLVAWPGVMVDRVAMQSLERRDARYEIVFASPDYRARLMAVANNIGVMPLPERLVDNTVIVAKDYYLSTLPALPVGVFARDEADKFEVAPILEKLARFAPGGAGLPTGIKPAADKSHHKPGAAGRRHVRG